MAIFIFIKTQEKTQRFKVSSNPLTVGRSSRCHVSLADPAISGQHFCVFQGEDGRTIVKDLGSTNGIFLNGSKVEDTAFYLDDIIQFGSNQLLLDDSEMSEREKSIHKKDYEKTNLTFVNMEPEITQSLNTERTRKTLLGEIRKQKQGDIKKSSQHLKSKLAIQNEESELKIESVKKSTKKKKVKKETKTDGMVTQIKKLFKI